MSIEASSFISFVRFVCGWPDDGDQSHPFFHTKTGGIQECSTVHLPKINKKYVVILCVQWLLQINWKIACCKKFFNAQVDVVAQGTNQLKYILS